MRDDIRISCETENDTGELSVRSLALYIADYVQHELVMERGLFVDLDEGMILNAIEAYQGGAR